jgi:hypothetical protein
MVPLPLVRMTVGNGSLIGFVLILSFATMGLPFGSQKAIASSWAAEKFEAYQQHPDWVSTRCQNMQKVNAKGESNYTEKVAELEKQYNPNFSKQSTQAILEFYHLFGQKFCQNVW